MGLKEVLRLSWISGETEQDNQDVKERGKGKAQAKTAQQTTMK